MKRIILAFILTISVMQASQAQLNSNAEIIRNKLPEVYNEIKTFVSEDWEGDHEMMVYTINGQCDAFMELRQLMNSENYDKEILGTALVQWKKTIKGKNCIDYQMVVYVYNNQIKAKSSY